jgi:hypothetical protein
MDCVYCNSAELLTDLHSGDTICTSCGSCQNDVTLDQFGNQPPDPKITLSTYGVSSTINNDVLRKRLLLVFEIYNVPSALQDYGLIIMTHIEQHVISMKGNNKDHTCIALLYLIYDNFGIFWDIDAVCKDFKIKTKKITKIANNLNVKTTCDESLKLQKHIFKEAFCMDISVKNLDLSVIRSLNNLSKSTKMKTAIALYIAAPPKLTDILLHTGIQKTQLLKAKGEMLSE